MAFVPKLTPEYYNPKPEGPYDPRAAWHKKQLRYDKVEQNFGLTGAGVRVASASTGAPGKAVRYKRVTTEGMVADALYYGTYVGGRCDPGGAYDPATTVSGDLDLSVDGTDVTVSLLTSDVGMAARTAKVHAAVSAAVPGAGAALIEQNKTWLGAGAVTAVLEGSTLDPGLAGLAIFITDVPHRAKTGENLTLSGLTGPYAAENGTHTVGLLISPTAVALLPLVPTGLPILYAGTDTGAFANIQPTYGDPIPSFPGLEVDLSFDAKFMIIYSSLPGDAGSIEVKATSDAAVVDALGLEVGTIDKRTSVGNMYIEHPFIRYEYMEFIDHPDFVSADIDYSKGKNFWSEANPYFPYSGFLDDVHTDGVTDATNGLQLESTGDAYSTEAMTSTGVRPGDMVQFTAPVSHVATVASVTSPNPGMDNAISAVTFTANLPAGLQSQTGVTYQWLPQDPNIWLWDHNGKATQEWSLLAGTTGMSKGVTVIPYRPGLVASDHVDLIDDAIANDCQILAAIFSLWGDQGAGNFFTNIPNPPNIYLDPSIVALVAKVTEAISLGMHVMAPSANFAGDVSTFLPPVWTVLLGNIDRVESFVAVGPRNHTFDNLDQLNVSKLSKYGIFNTYGDNIVSLAAPGAGYDAVFGSVGGVITPIPATEPGKQWGNHMHCPGQLRRSMMLSQQTALSIQAEHGGHEWWGFTGGTTPAVMCGVAIMSLMIEAYGGYSLAPVTGCDHADLLRGIMRSTAKDLVDISPIAGSPAPGEDEFSGRGYIDGFRACSKAKIEGRLRDI